MAASKESRKSSPRKTTPPADSSVGKRAGAPRRRTSEQRAAPLTGNARTRFSSDEPRQLIAETAYYKAQRRGFAPGHELEDWVQAEAEVLQRISPA